MPCKVAGRRLGLWTVIAIAIAAASMSSSEPRVRERETEPAAHITPHILFTLPLLA